MHTRILPTEPLVEQVLARLLEYIQRRKLPPGSVLPSEVLLAKEFGVSRPVVREALRALQGRAVIQLVKGKGALVRPLDAKPFTDFFQYAAMHPDFDSGLMMEEARNGMDTQCAYLAARRRTAAQLRELEEVLRRMRGAIGDKEAYWTLNLEFHRVIAKAAHNPVLALLVEALQQALDRLLHQIKISAKTIPGKLWPAMHPYHEKIYAHIRDRRAAAAAAATEAHLALALKITRRTK